MDIGGCSFVLLCQERRSSVRSFAVLTELSSLRAFPIGWVWCILHLDIFFLAFPMKRDVDFVGRTTR